MARVDVTCSRISTLESLRGELRRKFGVVVNCSENCTRNSAETPLVLVGEDPEQIEDSIAWLNNQSVILRKV